MTDRIEAFERKQKELAALDDAALKDRFWHAIDEMMQPVVEMARTHTSPSIERSVLMRMGIDSVTCHPVVATITDAGLLGKGAGHVVAKLAHERDISIREAAKLITEDSSVLDGLFEGR